MMPCPSVEVVSTRYVDSPVRSTRSKDAANALRAGDGLASYDPSVHDEGLAGARGGCRRRRATARAGQCRRGQGAP